MLNELIGSAVINKYASEIIDERQLETLLKWVEKNPGKTSLAAAGGLLGLTGLAAGIGAGIGIPMSMISKGIAKEYPTGNTGVVAEHPYLSNLASQAVLSSASLVHPSLGILNLARPPIEQSLGQKVLRDVDAGKSDGVLGKFTRKNPRLGSFASAFIPGAGLNSVIAGRSIAEQAKKDKSFMYRHPIIGAIGGSLIPGNASSYYNAAADILTGEV